MKIPGRNIKNGLVLASLWAATAVFANGIWLSSTNSLTYLGQQTNFGSGKINDPYYGDFDYIMGTKVPAKTVVNLGAGVFWTKGWAGQSGDSQIPAGVTLQGDGEGLTTVRRATNYSGYTGRSDNTLYSANSDVTVCNLTVDNNAFDFVAHGWTNALLGVTLYGRGNTLEHVTDINGYGYAYGFGPEGFQLSVGGIGLSGNKVIGCTVSNFFGQYGDGIAATGDCLVEGNHVFFSPQPAGVLNYNVFAINVCSSSRGSLVIDNYVYGGKDGFHNDTGGDINLVIANNVFENVSQGVYLSGDEKPYNSVIISHNLMTQLTNNTVYHAEMFVIDIETYQEGQTNQNIVVDGNIIRYYKDVPFTSDGLQGAMIIHSNPNGPYGGPNQLNENITIINNQIDARMPVEFSGPISNLYASGNIPLNGTNFATALGYPGLTNVTGSQAASQH
ncbi:MAG TPA: hypothetical protein VJT54_12710 [Verrucomicrobiae bacterium]|nr:hypothetical protein [Verrucomicrobiae bacterium]